jgi:hypothetical protein
MNINIWIYMNTYGYSNKCSITNSPLSSGIWIFEFFRIAPAPPCTYKYMYIYMHEHIRTYMYMNVCMYVCMYIYTQTYM